MKEKEKQLFMALCKFKDRFYDASLLEYATPAVLGYLFFNRMHGVAYSVLKSNRLLDRVNREFRGSLSAAFYQNTRKNESFRKCISTLSDTLVGCGCQVAMLKGAYLCFHYPNGMRTSNDVDLLVLPNDVTAIGKLLNKSGFVQGYIRNDDFIPATRREIIESKMMRGETVPYVKKVNLPFMKYFEVDINFSLGYKPEDNSAVASMLSHACFKYEGDLSLPSLGDSDFFIHLCAHLYKEATTLPWIEMHRDMSLYKYCDIYLLLAEMSDKQTKETFARAAELGMDKVCSYAVLETAELFGMKNCLAHDISREILKNDPGFRLRVTSPNDKKTLIYKTADACERFFSEPRKNDLTEECTNEKT